MEQRFRDPGKNVYSFMDETLVVCPKCSGCAISKQLDEEARPGWFAPRRLICTACPHTAHWEEHSIGRGWDDARDDYFHLPLWLQTPCCGEVLWAYNERHLAFLEDFVSARLRERTRDEKYGWSNNALASRLPAWIKSGKNRSEVLKGIARLRMRLP